MPQPEQILSTNRATWRRPHLNRHWSNKQSQTLLLSFSPFSFDYFFRLGAVVYPLAVAAGSSLKSWTRCQTTTNWCRSCGRNSPDSPNHRLRLLLSRIIEQSDEYVHCRCALLSLHNVYSALGYIDGLIDSDLLRRSSDARKQTPTINPKTTQFYLKTLWRIV